MGEGTPKVGKKFIFGGELQVWPELHGFPSGGGLGGLGFLGYEESSIDEAFRLKLLVEGFKSDGAPQTGADTSSIQGSTANTTIFGGLSFGHSLKERDDNGWLVSKSTTERFLELGQFKLNIPGQSYGYDAATGTSETSFDSHPESNWGLRLSKASSFLDYEAWATDNFSIGFEAGLKTSIILPFMGYSDFQELSMSAFSTKLYVGLSFNFGEDGEFVSKNVPGLTDLTFASYLLEEGHGVFYNIAYYLYFRQHQITGQGQGGKVGDGSGSINLKDSAFTDPLTIAQLGMGAGSETRAIDLLIRSESQNGFFYTIMVLEALKAGGYSLAGLMANDPENDPLIGKDETIPFLSSGFNSANNLLTYGGYKLGLRRSLAFAHLGLGTLETLISMACGDSAFGVSLLTAGTTAASRATQDPNYGNITDVSYGKSTLYSPYIFTSEGASGGLITRHILKDFPVPLYTQYNFMGPMLSLGNAGSAVHNLPSDFDEETGYDLGAPYIISNTLGLHYTSGNRDSAVAFSIGGGAGPALHQLGGQIQGGIATEGFLEMQIRVGKDWRILLDIEGGGVFTKDHTIGYIGPFLGAQKLF